jgi:hypothetical protein
MTNSNRHNSIYVNKIEPDGADELSAELYPTGRQLFIVHRQNPVIEEALSAEGKEPYETSDGKIAWKNKRETFWEPYKAVGEPYCGGERISVDQCSMGLLDRVTGALDRHQLKYRFAGEPTPQFKWDGQRRSRHQGLDEAVCHNFVGRIAANNPGQAAAYMADILTLMPRRGCVVVAKSNAVAAKLTLELRAVLPDDRQVYCLHQDGYPGGYWKKIPVMSISATNGGWMANRSLLFLWDWPVILSRKAFEMTTDYKTNWITVYGLAPINPPCHLSPLENLRACAVAGTVIYDAKNEAPEIAPEK